jgi:hypothetical protein
VTQREGDQSLRAAALDASVVGDADLEARLLDRSVANLRDLQYLYGQLATLSVVGTREDGEYLTPDQASHLLGGHSDDDSIATDTYIEVRLAYDASADEGQALRLVGVETRPLDVPTLRRLGLSKYSSARGMDHSLSRLPSKGGKPLDYWSHGETGYGKWYGKVAQSLKWADEAPVAEVAEDHPDGHLIRALSARRSDEHWCADVLAKRAADALPIVTESDAEMAAERGETPLPTEMEALVTFAIGRPTDADDPTGDPRQSPSTGRLTVTEDADPHRADGYDWYLPGEVPVLLDAMRARREHKLATKNNANARAEGVCYVTGEEGPVIGTLDDPSEWFQTKQTGYFPGFDRDRSALSHPISPRAALSIANSARFLDTCYDTLFGKRLYTMPYFAGEQTPAKARALYTLLEAIDAGDRTPIEAAYRLLTDPESAPTPLPDSIGALLDERGEALLSDLRFYTLAGQATQAGFHAFHEASAARVEPSLDLAAAHQRVLSGPYFEASNGDTNRTGVTARTQLFPTTEYDPDEEPFRLSLLAADAPEGDRRAQLLSGGYFRSANALLAYGEDGESRVAADPRVEAVLGVLSADGLSIRELLAGYAADLPAISDWSDTTNLTFTVASQYAQLTALAAADCLTSDEAMTDALTDPPRYMTDDIDADDSPTQPVTADGGQPASATDEDDEDGGPSKTERRHARLEQFIEDHPGLRENDERRAAFLLGALIGRVSQYQRFGPPGVNRTLVEQFAPSSLQPRRLQTVVQTAIEKTQTYSQVHNDGAQMYQELTRPLTDLVAGSDPAEWRLSRADLRMHYALGVSYAMGDRDDESEGSST